MPSSVGKQAPRTTVLHMTVHVDAIRLAVLTTSTSVSSTTSYPDTPRPPTSTPFPYTTLFRSSITKSDSPDPVTAGTDLTYTLTVKNAGPSFARSVQATDPVPAGKIGRAHV